MAVAAHATVTADPCMPDATGPTVRPEVEVAAEDDTRTDARAHTVDHQRRMPGMRSEPVMRTGEGMDVVHDRCGQMRRRCHEIRQADRVPPEEVRVMQNSSPLGGLRDVTGHSDPDRDDLAAVDPRNGPGDEVDDIGHLATGQGMLGFCHDPRLQVGHDEIHRVGGELHTGEVGRIRAQPEHLGGPPPRSGDVQRPFQHQSAVDQTACHAGETRSRQPEPLGDAHTRLLTVEQKLEENPALGVGKTRPVLDGR